MAAKKQKENTPFFQSGWNGKLPKIVAISLCFHLMIVIGIVVLNKLNFEREPEPVKKHTPRKKHSETELRELENRVKLLEQQVSFLKKSRHLRDTGQMIPPHSSS